MAMARKCKTYDHVTVHRNTDILEHRRRRAATTEIRALIKASFDGCEMCACEGECYRLRGRHTLLEDVAEVTVPCARSHLSPSYLGSQ